MNTTSGVISQKYYNASISFFEIPAAGTRVNDSTDLLWSWMPATSTSPKINSDSEFKEPHGSIYYGFLSCYAP